MGKINGCLKCFFIFFNVVFVLLGCLLVWAAVKAKSFSDALSAVGGPSPAWVWVFAIGVLAVSVFGIVAACMEKELVLKIFAGLMAAGCLIMLIFGIYVVVMRNKVKAGFDDGASKVTKDVLADKNMDDNQRNNHCCGVTGPADWGKEIPDSCRCLSSSTSNMFGNPCSARPKDTTGPDQIYSMGCAAFLFVFIDLFFKASMGFFFTFAGTALLGLLMTLLMICQVRKHDGAAGSSIAMKGY